jgi:hypothetical protein
LPGFEPVLHQLAHFILWRGDLELEEIWLLQQAHIVVVMYSKLEMSRVTQSPPMRLYTVESARGHAEDACLPAKQGRCFPRLAPSIVT